MRRDVWQKENASWQNFMVVSIPPSFFSFYIFRSLRPTVELRGSTEFVFVIFASVSS